MDPVGPCLEVLIVDTQIRELRVETDVRWEVEMVETRYVVSRRVKLASPASPVRTKHAGNLVLHATETKREPQRT